MWPAGVATLPPRLRSRIIVEYFSGGSREQKDERIGVSTMDFREGLRSALWVLYARIESA